MQQLRRVLLHHNLRLETQARRKAQVFVEGTRITIDAAMLAASIRIDARLKTNVRAVVVSDDRAGAIFEKLRARQRVLFRVPIRIRFEVYLLETIGRVAGCAARGQQWGAGTHRKRVNLDWIGINGRNVEEMPAV